jgi:hemolysin-activating ACP:hemolysin acyltransferase
MGARLEFSQLPPTFESLGVVIDLMSESAAFDHFEFGPLIKTISAQIAQRHHLCAFDGPRLVGYCGFLPVHEGQAMRWLKGEAALEEAPAGKGDAVALTIVAVRQRHALLPLLRFCRRGFPGMRVFFKRSYARATRGARKSTVMNCKFDHAGN